MIQAKPSPINDPDRFEISEANLDQLGAIVDVNYQIFKGMYENEPYTLAHYQKILSGKEPKILVAKIADEIIGDSVSFERDGSLYIWIMGVLEVHRQKGVATKLLEINERFATDNNYRSLMAKVSNVSPGMLRLLLARGYQITDIEPSATDTKYNVLHLKLRI